MHVHASRAPTRVGATRAPFTFAFTKQSMKPGETDSRPRRASGGATVTPEVSRCVIVSLSRPVACVPYACRRACARGGETNGTTHSDRSGPLMRARRG